VTDAGRTMIQVVDDGKGMSETDARLAFERHATSKIRKADDLFSLQTMGFRGEALPSIAAVAQVQLTTRMAGEELGTRIMLEGSHVTRQEAASCPVGSNFVVENLFFNVPARRKFLKTNTTELANIMTAFERIVLVYPEISFTLHSNGQELLNLKAGTLRQRICDVFGRKMSQELLPIEVDTTLCHISGFVGKPESARKKGAHTYFFVNGRYMRHPYFHKAVTNAFERLVPEGMQVPYFIYFDVAPADIDVNIHPTKTEIKFENEQSIWQILTAGVKDAIGRFCEVPTIDFDTEGKPDIPVFDPMRDSVKMPSVSYNPVYNPFKGVDKQGSEGSIGSFRSGEDYLSPELQPDLFNDDVPTATPEEITSEKSPAHYQFKGRFIMTAVKSGLMVIDQQRADIRVRYEHYLQQMGKHAASSQRLLFPEVVQFAPAESVFVKKVQNELHDMGFELNDLGGGSYAVGGVPAELDGLAPVSLLRNIVSDAMEQGTATPDELHTALALSLARHAAIPIGQVLSNEEMEHLVNQLFACANVNYTPDGQAILSILPQADIEKLLD